MQSRLYAEIAHASIATMSLRAFICISVRLQVYTVRDQLRARTYAYRQGLGMALLALIIYTRVRIVRPFICANCVREYTIEHAYARAYICACTCIRERLRLFTRKKRKRSFLCAYACICVRAFACVCLRACLHADLIKTQNAFARKIFQHANALWVHKLSGCTIHVR